MTIFVKPFKKKELKMKISQFYTKLKKKSQKTDGWSQFLTARLSRRIVFWIFMSILFIELIILVPSIQRRKIELLTQVKQLSETKIYTTLDHFPQISYNDFLSKILTKNESYISGGAFYSLNGKPLKFIGETPASPFENNENVRSEYFTKHWYDAVWKIQLHKTEYYIVLRHNISNIQREIFLFILRIIGLVAIISTFVSMATMLVLKTTLITPILQLRKDLKSSGESVVRGEKIALSKFPSLAYSRKDELKDVIQTFRQVYLQVHTEITKRSQVEKELAQLNSELEERVKHRTSELVKEIEERQRMEELLRYNAYHDELTDLGNRAFLIENLRNSLRNLSSQEQFAVFFLDIDRFKVVNDSLGHTLGDKLLVAISSRLKGFFRRENTIITRLGGDEFAIIKKQIKNIEEATNIAVKINQDIIKPFYIDGHELFITVSIGIALSSELYKEPEAILRDADLVMYRAKDLGRARYEVFDAAMHNRILEQMQLETDLRRSIKKIENGSQKQEFEIFFQPIVQLKNQKIAGFEALVRWFHPTKGLISPSKFIPKAEETGLIVPLGDWILSEACQQLAQWHIKYPRLKSLQVSVNLSGRQFRQYNLAEQVKGILRNTGLNGNLLKLEITESSLVDDPDLARSMLLKLKEQNVKLSMDDFGTGYSSLSYLHQFPFDTLKIDRSFILRLQKEGKEIVQTIVALAHTLGMDVVAEGVETKEQLEALVKLKCQYGQGYYFGKPQKSEEADKYLH